MNADWAYLAELHQVYLARIARRNVRLRYPFWARV